MILIDREIKTAIDRGLLIVDPPPSAQAYASTSLDLTLDAVISEFREQKGGLPTVVDPGSEGFSHEEVLEAITKQITIGDDGHDWYDFIPGKLILAWTTEYVHLINETRIAARVEGKSSLARLGVGVHITAPTIHAGFEGRIRLEMINHGKYPVRLRTGMSICQLIFEQTLGTSEKGYKGRFARQTTTQKG